VCHWWSVGGKGRRRNAGKKKREKFAEKQSVPQLENNHMQIREANSFSPLSLIIPDVDRQRKKTFDYSLVV
jgi:hypothetical protein